jgi:hypothetical protein
MKINVIMIGGVLAVMVLMTGIVLAASIEVDPPVLTISQGGTGTQTVTIPAGSQSLAVTGKGFDLETTFSVQINGVEGTSVDGPWSQPKTFTVTFKNDKGAQNGDYIIEYGAPYNSGKFTLTATIEAGITAIPEFPTIALPVGAAIGLVFFFQHRKIKEEQ